MRTRALFLACVLCLMASLAGCSFFEKKPEQAEEDPSTLSKPEHAVMVVLDGIKAANAEAVKSAVVFPKEMLTGDVEATFNNPLAKAAVKSMFKNMEYDVVKVNEAGDTAALTLAVTYPNLEPIIVSNFNSFAPQIAEELKAGTFDMAGTQSKILWAVAADLIAGKAINTQTTEIEVNCQKVDGKWMVSPERPILNVCTGGALDALDKLDYSLLSQ